MQLPRGLSLLLATGLFVLPTPSIMLHLGKIVALSVIFVTNRRWGEPRVRYAFALFLGVVLLDLIPALHLWNPLVVPTMIFVCVAWVRPRWLDAQRWLLRGHTTGPALVLSLLTVPLSAGALVGWAYVTQPDLAIYADMIPGTEWSVLFAAAIVFALLNALAEEVLFRGVLWHALEDIGLSWGLVLMVQAAAFGVLHWGGVPSGLPGVALATLYGLALGGMRYLSRGLLVPVTVHVFADLTIFLIIMRLAERW